MGKKGFIQLTLPHCCSSSKEFRTGTQAGQEAGADSEAMEGCSVLAGFVCQLDTGWSYHKNGASVGEVPPGDPAVRHFLN